MYIVPENVLPICVIDHVAPPPIGVTLPIMVPLESDALPVHVPVIVVDEVGIAGEDIILLSSPHAATMIANANITR
jgi:hypothetical protein